MAIPLLLHCLHLGLLLGLSIVLVWLAVVPGSLWPLLRHTRYLKHIFFHVPYDTKEGRE